MINKLQMHIGLDDTDSTRRGCTTYIAALLVEKLEKLKVKFVDYPNLVRLNPNVPWKTRGNGALCLRIEYEKEIEEEIEETTLGLVKKHADLEFENTNPGIVFFKKGNIPTEICAFAKKAITGIANLGEAKELLERCSGKALGFNNCRGIIGGLAAIGETLKGDHTFELIAYRLQENYGSKRKVDKTSIFEMDQATKPQTFNNVDSEKNRVIITPHGPDPILLGIRGETPEIVRKAFEMVKLKEPVERWIIFRTNQGTDSHFGEIAPIQKIVPYTPMVAEGTVSKSPWIVPLRHVFFSLKDITGEIDCAAYEPTGSLRKVARSLVVGDKIRVYGGLRRRSENKPLTLNLEKIRIIGLAKKTRYQNPLCPKCLKRLKSMGKNKGYRCENCKLRFKGLKKIPVKIERKTKLGLCVTSPRSQRHLTKPLRRYGLEKHHLEVASPTVRWHSFWDH